MFQAAGRRSRPVVLDDELQRAVAVLDAQPRPAVGRSGFDGVAQHAAEGGPHLADIDVQAPVLGWIVANQTHVFLPRGFLQRFADFLQNPSRRHELRMRSGRLGELHEIGEQQVDALSLADDRLQRPAELGFDAVQQGRGRGLFRQRVFGRLQLLE